MSKDIRLIALDLDGTLLTTDKRLTDRNRTALLRAGEKGMTVVPVTGRIFNGLPRSVLGLSCLKYAILSNGASVYDVANDRLLCRAEIPLDQALDIMAWLDGQPVIYDCYAEGRGFMTEAMWNQIDRYAWSPIVVDYMKSIRTPVPELKAFLRQKGWDIQKIQAFCRDDETQRRLLGHMPFSGIAVSSSVPRNIEINREDATKGRALLALAKHLGLEREQVMAFGDGLNDISMIESAGVGVAMGNAVDEVRRVADIVTATNDEDGVAAVIEALL
ncbi:MAG: HAD family phosphatase [Clostridia bacterium]|nr:HAD family phosphatase [Clostridia bacterium]